MRPSEPNRYRDTQCWEAELWADKPNGPRRLVYTYAATEKVARAQFGHAGIYERAIRAVRPAPPLVVTVEVDKAPAREVRK